MVRDVKTKTCYRADHVLKGHIETILADPATSADKKQELESLSARIDDLNEKELTEKMKSLDVRSPDTGNELSEPQPFNLMFQTSIGPTGDLVGFLRPETAQGIFVNFRRILDYNGGQLPVAAAQVGQGILFKIFNCVYSFFLFPF
jgi:glycyl-tRNA synthetase